MDQNVLKLDGGDYLSNCEYIKTTEFYTLNGYILWYLNYISIKLLLKKNIKNIK